MHIFKLIKEKIVEIAANLLKNHDINSNSPIFSVEVPKNPEHGDIATNIAMVLSKQLQQKPIDIAKYFISTLCADMSDYIQKAEVAVPGFINLKLKHDVLHNFLLQLNENGTGIYDPEWNIGNNEKVNIEFVSANPTGPMHIGHARGAIYGDTLCRLMRRCGFNVTAEYYINDAGTQINILAESLYIRYRQLLGENIEIPEGCYPGEYLCDIAMQLKNEYGDTIADMQETARKALLCEFAVEKVMSLIKKDLAILGVKHDVFTSEKSLINDGMVEKAIEILKAKNLIYHGSLDKPKSQSDAVDWEEREQLLFRSTRFGDDLDRPILKSDGSYAYFASDIALHMNKISCGYHNMLLLLGADHLGYIHRISAAVQALSDNKATINVLINQLVNILKDGRPIKMSKRKGNFVTVSDLVEEVGVDTLRFAMLMHKNDTVLNIDCDKVKEKSKDNPIFYVQYAHTRVASILRNAYKADIITDDEIAIADKGVSIGYKYAPNNTIDYSLLKSDIEIDLMKKLVQFPKVIEFAALQKEPHHITYYLYELATQFHTTWHAGIIQEDMRFIIESNIPLSRARVGMVYAVASTIGCAMDIIGVKPMLEM